MFEVQKGSRSRTQRVNFVYIIHAIFFPSSSVSPRAVKIAGLAKVFSHLKTRAPRPRRNTLSLIYTKERIVNQTRNFSKDNSTAGTQETRVCVWVENERKKEGR